MDKAQGHDLSDALRSSEDLAEVADRVWNCLNLVPGLQALRLYRSPWAACLGNCACISSWQKHIRGTIHLDGHPLHRVRSSHTAQTKTPLRGFFGRESLSEARAHRLESRGDFAVQASKVAHQTAGRSKVIWGSPRDLGGSPSVGGQRWIPGGWKVNGGSRAVVGSPEVPEFCEGSSTGPGGFAGHLGVRASAIMPDVDGVFPDR